MRTLPNGLCMRLAYRPDYTGQHASRAAQSGYLRRMEYTYLQWRRACTAATFWRLPRPALPDVPPYLTEAQLVWLQEQRAD